MNMVNNHWLIAKALRRAGLEVDLIISAKDFGMSLPHWEEADIVGVNPYTIDIDELSRFYTLPEWVKIWDPRDLYVSPRGVIDLLYMVKGYDLVQLAPPSVIYLQFLRKKFIVHETGWIRRFPFLDGAAEKLARRGYAKAECIVMTNPDSYGLLQKISYRKEVFIPFIVETDRYEPIDVEREDDTLSFFHPTRQAWSVKGNDRLIRAFGKFINNGYKAKLDMVDWGTPEDTEQSRNMIKRLGIEENVQWLNPASKPRLIQLYNQSDAVFDQFGRSDQSGGSYGTTAPEAMACGKPVVMYLEQYWNRKCYGEIAPVLNARTPDEIFEAMVALTDPDFRRRLGDKGRRYVIQHHSSETIARQYVRLYEETLS